MEETTRGNVDLFYKNEVSFSFFFYTCKISEKEWNEMLSLFSLSLFSSKSATPTSSRSLVPPRGLQWGKGEKLGLAERRTHSFHLEPAVGLLAL